MHVRVGPFLKPVEIVQCLHRLTRQCPQWSPDLARRYRLGLVPIIADHTPQFGKRPCGVGCPIGIQPLAEVLEPSRHHTVQLPPVVLDIPNFEQAEAVEDDHRIRPCITDHGNGIPTLLE